MNEEHRDALLAEIAEWQSWLVEDREVSLDVYLDLKSPHAYLAVRPTLEVARDYRVRVNLLPYTLSYTALGISTSVEADMQRRPGSDAADRKARMYYAAAREYARLQRLPFRTPQRLLDSDVANRAFLFAKRQSAEVPFLMQVYIAGWGTGWREYELESLEQLKNTLEVVGVDLDGFEKYMAPGGQGETELAEHMSNAEAAGFAGVPHYVFDDVDSGRRLGLFGREHLALIRSKFHARGLARRADVAPEFSHAWQR